MRVHGRVYFQVLTTKYRPHDLTSHKTLLLILTPVNTTINFHHIESLESHKKMDVVSHSHTFVIRCSCFEFTRNGQSTFYTIQIVPLKVF
jgi:hypothetical protein